MNQIEEPNFKISTILKFLEKRYGEIAASSDMVKKSIAYKLAKIEQEAGN